MTISLFDSKIYHRLFVDEAVQAIFSDQHRIDSMLRVEVALATAQANLKIIPEEAAQAIAMAADSFCPDYEAIAEDTAQSGVPVIQLVSQLQSHTGDPFGQYVHWGATSQDIIDCAHLLQIKEALGLIEQRQHELVNLLAALADRYRTTLMVGRTRSQQAVPISFGLKVANWLAPLITHQQRLDELRPRLFVVQLGGAAGTSAALKDKGIQTMELLAQNLDFSIPALPWHSRRDNLVELGNWLSLVTGSLAKIGQDIILMCQNEIAELHIRNDQAGSSTMPNKSNPIGAEMLLTAAMTNAALINSLYHAQQVDHERATATWQLEWLALPQMIAATAGALDKAIRIIETLEVNQTRMLDNLKLSNGLVLAEAATFLLTESMPRIQAKQIVTTACQQVNQGAGNLLAVLQDIVETPVEWELLEEPKYLLGSTNQFIDRLLATVSR